MIEDLIILKGVSWHISIITKNYNEKSLIFFNKEDFS